MQSGVEFTGGSGAASYKLDDNRQAQKTEGVQTAESLHQQDLRSLSNAQSNQLVKAADFISHVAQREHNGETFKCVPKRVECIIFTFWCLLKGKEMRFLYW